MQTYDSPGAAPRVAAYVAKPKGGLLNSVPKKVKKPRKARAHNKR